MADTDVLSVSGLNAAVAGLLEDAFPLVWVEGEISNLARPRSGHLYFSLKDDAAQVRCAMFRNRNYLLRFRPVDGAQILVRARVSLYSQRGEFQLVVEHMEESGEGALRRQFEALREKLEMQGLFEAEHKRPLPRFPRRVGVVTSPTGAALRDILQVLERRFPSLPVLIYPTPVQGADAAARIARQLAVAGERGECDVIILGRGGGSLEDLQAFNDETVVRAICDCPIPLVSAVGHETDITIADLAADVRAPTPSAAAEIVSPSRSQLEERVHRYFLSVERNQKRRFAQHAQQLDWLERRVGAQHPKRQLAQVQERVSQLQARLRRASRQHRQSWQAEVRALGLRLWNCSPAGKLDSARVRTRTLESRLERATKTYLSETGTRLSGAARSLGLASPLGTLDRGYALITRTDDGSVVRDAAEIATGDKLSARLARGTLTVSVLRKGT